MKGKNVKFKITVSTIGCFLAGMLIILLVLFFYLQSVFDSQNQKMLGEIGDKYANMISDTFENPVSFLTGICSVTEAQIQTQTTDREALQAYIARAFDKYTISEGTAFMLESDVYDGKDSEYINTDYGTPTTGQISYYYFRENGKTSIQPYIEEDYSDFSQPYYTIPKAKKVPIFTDPYLYTLNGKTVSMITASYPMMNDSGNVLGVATVDLYLDSIHKILTEEEIFDTGYIVVVSESGSILYCPDLSLVGEDAKATGLFYDRPSGNDTVQLSSVKSYINKKDSLVATVPLQLELADSKFYISVVVPKGEASAAQNTLIIVMIGIFILVGAAIFIVVTITANGIEIDLKKIIEKLTSASQIIKTSANQLNASSENLAAGSSRQAASIEETSATMNETASMVSQNAESTRVASQIAADVTRSTDESSKHITELMSTMTELKESSDKVGKIVKTIDDIAFQTNLLAINATVEAARAGGDAGRSFAVVAQEVRNLAQKSADASKETAEIIEKNINLTDASRAAAEEVLEISHKNEKQTVDLGKLISEINAASEEQASGIKQINAAVSQMEKVTQENAAVAEENAATSNSMSDEIAHLEEAVNIATNLVKKNDGQ